MIHIYEGFCPDELQPDSRDPNCPACRVEAERDALLKRVTAMEAELQKLSYFTEPHAKGALGRWLTADEMIREWSKRAANFDDEIEAMEAERDALRTAYAVAAAIMRSQPVGIAPRLVNEWRAAAVNVEEVGR